MKASHGIIGFISSIYKPFVALFKLFAFLFGVGKRLGHANTRNTALQRSIDLRIGFSAFQESIAHLAAQAVGHKQQQRCADENDERQPNVDGGKIGKSGDDGDGAVE